MEHELVHTPLSQVACTCILCVLRDVLKLKLSFENMTNIILFQTCEKKRNWNSSTSYCLAPWTRLFRHRRGKSRQQQGNHSATSWCKDASNSNANYSRNTRNSIDASTSMDASNNIDKGRSTDANKIGPATEETARMPATGGRTTMEML